MIGYTQAELTEMLAEVRTAITKCLTAQEYQAGGAMSLRRPRLKDLEARVPTCTTKGEASGPCMAGWPNWKRI